MAVLGVDEVDTTPGNLKEEGTPFGAPFFFCDHGDTHQQDQWLMIRYPTPEIKNPALNDVSENAQF